MNNLQIFNYEKTEIRTVKINNEPWWVLKDVCGVLKLTSPHKVAERLDEDEKGRSLIPTLGGNQEVAVVNESGLYNVILRSDKPEAKKFKRWVTHEVLPTIRSHGMYATPETVEKLLADPNTMIRVLQELQSEQEARKALEELAEVNQPKVLFADAVSTSDTTILVGDLAKLAKQNGMDIGANRLFEWMRKSGYLINRRGADYNMPTQRSMELGVLRIKESITSQPDGCTRITKTPKVTGKGQIYFLGKLLKKED